MQNAYDMCPLHHSEYTAADIENYDFKQPSLYKLNMNTRAIKTLKYFNFYYIIIYTLLLLISEFPAYKITCCFCLLTTFFIFPPGELFLPYALFGCLNNLKFKRFYFIIRSAVVGLLTLRIIYFLWRPLTCETEMERSIVLNLFKLYWVRTHAKLFLKITFPASRISYDAKC